jgi:hypothetical protein
MWLTCDFQLPEKLNKMLLQFADILFPIMCSLQSESVLDLPLMLLPMAKMQQRASAVTVLNKQMKQPAMNYSWHELGTKRRRRNVVGETDSVVPAAPSLSNCLHHCFIDMDIIHQLHNSANENKDQERVFQ